jgi:hypothetical protein
MEHPTEAEVRAWERSVAIRKWILRIALLSLPIGLIAIFVIQSAKQNPQPVITRNVEPERPASKTEAPAESLAGMQEAEFNGYPYSYKREGDRTIAMFVKRFLPRDDTIVVGAIRDVIRRAYKEEANGSPYLVDWNANGTATRAIRVDGAKSGFIVLPVKEDTGEIHSLSITRVARN